MQKSIHQKIVNEIIEEQKKDFSVIAINLFGSVAIGKERYNSDVDIEIILIKGKKWQLNQTEKRYGVKIDFVVCSKDKLLEIVEKYPFLCYDYLNEKVVYDPHKFMKRIISKLNRYFTKHPEVVEFWEKKLKSMREAKNKGEKPEDPFRVFDEAEIKFSDVHKVTRDFFRK